MSRPVRFLPGPAQEFIDSLRPTHKRSTCDNYRQALFRLHDWLERHRYPLKDLKREQTARWLQYLQERGQSAATRVNVIVPVRAYLRALNDAGLLKRPADELLRPSDLPKLPRYLPRPLEPAVDRELQRRLATSPKPYHRGLLVMRNTGLRVGELSALTFDCLREDELGNTFLKVPLGKMNSERLVPLDGRTRALIEELRRTGRPNRRLLLETPRRRQTKRYAMQRALDEVTSGLDTTRVTTHRLRHTYATTLLNAGMSLVSIMRLLGHRDHSMTLRYAAITLETVGTEYRAALAQLEKRYPVAPRIAAPRTLQPTDAISDIILWVQKRSVRNPSGRGHSIVKRLKRIRDELGNL